MSRLSAIRNQWNVKIFGQEPFPVASLALEAFAYQYAQNAVYRSYVQALGIDPRDVTSLHRIPFLPIRFFKTARVVSDLSPTDTHEPVLPNRAAHLALLFESSGTTETIRSQHLVADKMLYEESFLRGFERAYGPPRQWRILALLPSYLERKNSSLVYMAERLILESGDPQSGFYLSNLEQLHRVLQQGEKDRQPTLLLGVSFALLELAARFALPLYYTRIIETGGMKGRSRELIRRELHHQLQAAFGVDRIESEYGMTELLSQAWSAGEGLFSCPPWMKVLVREEEDPLTVHNSGSGALNIIDLANIDSCCFIATEDAGKVHADGRFEVNGRLDNTDIRGCSQLSL